MMTDTTPETMTAWQQQQQQVHDFIAALGDLDAGGRARLKRNAGRSLEEAHDIHRVFFPIRPHGLSPWREADYFLIATLFPLVPHHNPQGGNLGDTLRQVRQARMGSSDGRMHSLDRRFQALLDSDREQLPFRLRQAVRLVAADRDGAAINWEQLLLDVCQWEYENRVQLRWARAYFVGTDSISDTSKGDQS